LEKLWKVLQWNMLIHSMSIWYFFRPFFKLWCHLVCFKVIWFIFPVLVCCTEKNLATLADDFAKASENAIHQISGSLRSFMIFICSAYWRFSQKPMLWSHFLHNLALFWIKNANFFAEFFRENILKIITSVPGSGKPGHSTYGPNNPPNYGNVYWNECNGFVSPSVLQKKNL
jgi:hypothetical protein